jgi:hypothetical protein
MVKVLSYYEFVNEFHSMGRGNQFTNAGLLGLYEMLEQFEDETGEPWVLDVIALCCDYSEYGDALEAADDYTTEQFEDESEALEWLQEKTQVIELDNGGVIIQTF